MARLHDLPEGLITHTLSFLAPADLATLLRVSGSMFEHAGRALYSTLHIDTSERKEPWLCAFGPSCGLALPQAVGWDAPPLSSNTSSSALARVTRERGRPNAKSALLARTTRLFVSADLHLHADDRDRALLERFEGVAAVRLPLRLDRFHFPSGPASPPGHIRPVALAGGSGGLRALTLDCIGFSDPMSRERDIRYTVPVQHLSFVLRNAYRWVPGRPSILQPGVFPPGWEYEGLERLTVVFDQWGRDGRALRQAPRASLSQGDSRQGVESAVWGLSAKWWCDGSTRSTQSEAFKVHLVELFVRLAALRPGVRLVVVGLENVYSDLWDGHGPTVGEWVQDRVERELGEQVANIPVPHFMTLEQYAARRTNWQDSFLPEEVEGWVF